MAKFNGAVENIEDNRNKVTSLSDLSTDTQYPTAKCVYDAIQAALYVDTSEVIIAAEV